MAGIFWLRDSQGRNMAGYPAIQRFEAKYEPEPMSGCWLWIGSCGPRSRGGYPQFRWNGRVGYAHRFAYEHFVGTIPSGLVIDHRCNTPICVNPRHLRLATIRQNIERGKKPVFPPRSTYQKPPLKTHCKHGHSFSGDNLAIYMRRGMRRRRCRACARTRTAVARRRAVRLSLL